jgi:Rieske Fe-S protein
MTEPELDRRSVMVGGAALGAGVLLAGCAAAPTASTSAPAAPASGTVLGATSAVPVGGGAIFPDQKVVVTQPTAGTFVGLSAVCTHQGCVVAKVEAGTIDCACHGSKFQLDGTVAKGPAAKPLTPVKVTVKGSDITLA